MGEYDDTRPEVIAQHLAWSRQANIKLWVCSWWGPGSREDETIRTAILPNPDLGKHQIALLYESTGRVKAAEGWSPHRVQDDMRHICQEYFDHPNYYKVDGVPVIVMYLSRLLHKADALETVVTIMRETAREVCDTEIFILGDQVWGPAPTEEYMPFELLDAVTNYDIYGNVNKAPFAGQQAVNNYYQDQREWSVQAAKRGVRYVPGVSPGYNDRAVRLYKDNIGLSRRLTPDSEPGTLFAAQLQQARYLVDSGIHNLLMVNSFNEWHEDSQIEPAIGEPTNLPVEMTSGNTYEGYGELYLNLLRTATCTENCLPIDQWRSTYLEQDPMDSPPPDDILVGAYYFAWYADDFYGNRGWLRNELQQQPQLGKYDDRDPAVIAQHLEWSRRANIGLWITSWAGPNDDRDTTLRNVIFPHEDLEDHKIALLYEVQNRVKEKENWNLERVAADIEYVCHSYLDLPNYYTSKGGKPVIFLAQTRTLYSKGVLEDVVDMIRLVAKTHGYDIFLVGDQVWSEAPRDEIYLPFFSLDAVTNYDIYGNMGTYGYAGQDKVDKYYERQREWRDKAWKSKCAFVPGVTPGFNDRGTRLHANHHALSRILTEEEGTGSFFRASLTKARYLVDSDLHNLLVVNSFNNWMEDTQIEPIQTDVPPSSIPEELTEGLTYFGYGDLYLEILSNATQDLIPKNDTDPHFNGMFYPLRCNVIASLSTMECTETWTSLYGTTVEHLKEIEIPCGSCVVLDHPEPVLKLLGGLDIQGKLVIPDGYKVSIEATHIRVQGELQIISSKVVDGTPNVRILLVNGEPGIEKFQPALSNTNACGVQRCDPGPKSIFVVGGKLDIRGLAPDTPTLANLIDVVTEAHLPPLYRPEVCPSNGKYILGRFDQDFSASIFSGTPGSHVVHGESSLLVLDRTSTQHGVQIDLQSIRECLSSEESYILSMKLRVNRKGMEQVSTECATLGQNCLQVYSDFMNQSQVLTSITKYEGPVRSKFNYGEWMTIEEHISFRTEELDLSNIYLTLRVAGGDQGADIELEHFSLQLSPQDSCSSPTPDCRDLVLCNGDAEFGMEQTPFYEKGDVLIRTEVENYGNHFWRVYREEAISVLSGIQWDIPVECMKENAVYRFKMRIRVHPHENHPDPIITSVYIRSHRAGSDTQTRVTNCPPSAGKWVSCDGYMLVTSAMLGDLDNVSVYFETVGSTDTTYDVDDLSFKFVHMDGPVTGLVVEGIKEKWTTGSEILITSHTLNWDDQVVRTISGIENYGEDGQVLIELNSPITRPPAQRGSDFPVEVALLSRNIVFEAAKEGSEESSHQGGRLTVFHTPDVQQTIEGVEFKNFGQQGVADAHVSIDCMHLGASVIYFSQRLFLREISLSSFTTQRVSQALVYPKMQFGSQIKDALFLLGQTKY